MMDKEDRDDYALKPLVLVARFDYIERHHSAILKRGIRPPIPVRECASSPPRNTPSNISVHGVY